MVVNGFLLIILASILITVVSEIFLDDIISFQLSHKVQENNETAKIISEETKKFTKYYIRYLVIYFLIIFFATLFRFEGKLVFINLVMFSLFFLNILLNILFVQEMGVSGSAHASGVCWLIGCLIFAGNIFLDQNSLLRFNFFKIKNMVSTKLILGIIVFGIPSFLTNTFNSALLFYSSKVVSGLANDFNDINIKSVYSAMVP